MNLPTLMSDLRATKRFPTEAEADLIAREGSLADVGEALVITCALNPVLRKRYSELFRASQQQN